MAKRTRGAGGKYLRGNIWWLTYFAHGRQIQESTHQSDEAEADRQLKVRLGEIAAGKDVAPRRATISDICNLVVADYKLRGLRDAVTLSWRIEAHIQKPLGSLLASRFTPHQVRQYVQMRRAEEAADATINRELAILRRGFNLALREDPPLVTRPPYVPKLGEDNVRQGFIEHAQYLALRDALPDHLKAMMVVAYHCGNRVGELRSLTWSQVDLAGRQIRIQKKHAKTKKPRTIPVYGDMIEWLEWQREKRTAGCDYVFHYMGRQIGGHLKGWERGCRAAGLEGLHFHDLRRSAIRNMERAGIPRHISMGISGHRTESVYRRYDIVVEQDLQVAAEKLTVFHQAQQQAPQLQRVK
jgi:integrase